MYISKGIFLGLKKIKLLIFKKWRDCFCSPFFFNLLNHALAFIFTSERTTDRDILMEPIISGGKIHGSCTWASISVLKLPCMDRWYYLCVSCCAFEKRSPRSRKWVVCKKPAKITDQSSKQWWWPVRLSLVNFIKLFQPGAENILSSLPMKSLVKFYPFLPSSSYTDSKQTNKFIFTQILFFKVCSYLKSNDVRKH